MLLFLFNPIVSSLRSLRQASTLEKVQSFLGCQKTSLGSLSESARLFDAQALEPIIEQLSAQAGKIQQVAGDHVRHTLTAVDGSIIRTLCTVAEAAYLRDRGGGLQCGWRLHTHFEIERGVPVGIDVTPANGRGPNSEKAVLRERLESDRCYVLDRGFLQFTLFNEIHAAGSSYVSRLRDDLVWEVVEERPLSDAARAEGVIFDGIVRLGLGSSAEDRPDHTTRLVIIRSKPHPKRADGKRRGRHVSDGYLRIATDLLDPPAEVIGNIFRYRWEIEIFFRFLKHILGCRHLLSLDPGVIRIQVYCAIIACLLMATWAKTKIDLRTYEMICWYLLGWASEAELEEHLAKQTARSPPAGQKQQELPFWWTAIFSDR